MADRRRPRVLVVEGDDEMRSTVVATLTEVKYVVRAVADGSDIGLEARTFLPDVALLETRMPTGPDGFAIAEALRAEVADLPLLFVTVADSMSDTIAGLEAGADAYLTKPFDPEELLARVRAALRRARRLTSRVIAVGDLLIDERARHVVRGGAAVQLTPSEYDLLSVFVHHPGQTFTKSQLRNEAWDRSVDLNAVEARVSSLRRKLEAHRPRLIHTLHGRGYVFVAQPAGSCPGQEPVV